MASAIGLAQFSRLTWGSRPRTRFSEIDLVAFERGTVVFVEVKTRRGPTADNPTEAIHADKRRRLTRAALAYLKAHGLLEQRVRFDVVAVRCDDQQRAPEIKHYRHAFRAQGRGPFFA